MSQPSSSHRQPYGYGRTVEATFEATLARARAAIEHEGLEILSEVDLQAELQGKLAVQFRPYRILGVYSPILAHRALLDDLDRGLHVPYNIVVYPESDTRTAVKAIDAQQTMSLFGEASEQSATEVDERLRRVIDRL